MRTTSGNIRRSLLATGLLIAAGPAFAQATSQGAVPGAADSKGTVAVQPAPATTPHAGSAPAAPHAATSPAPHVATPSPSQATTVPAKPQGSAASTAPSGAAASQAAKPALTDRHGSTAPAAPATSGGPARSN